MLYHPINPFIKIAADNAGKLQSINRENKKYTYTNRPTHTYTG